MVVLNVFLIGFLYLLTPWFIADVFDGRLNSITLTGTHLLVGAVWLQLPILMMVLNVYRRDVWCRRLNIGASLLCLFVLAITVDLSMYILLVAVITVVAFGKIVFLSWSPVA